MKILLRTSFISLLLVTGLCQAKEKLSLSQIDSLFASAQWNKAMIEYESYVREHPKEVKAITWARLGFCYHNLKNYKTALDNYKKALSIPSSRQIKPILASRMARSYALLADKDNAFAWLDSAAKAGYANIAELDTLKDYRSLRSDSRFPSFYKNLYAAVYPCASNPKNREFDFWIGEWDVYQTGSTSPIVGHSLIQNVSSGCVILENWTSMNGSHNGKSMNYFDAAKGKWEQVWMGSANDFQHFVDGEYKDDAMRFTFETTGANGRPAIGRFIFYNQGPDKVRQFSEQSLDNGKTWQTNYDFTYIRKKGK